MIHRDPAPVSFRRFLDREEALSLIGSLKEAGLHAMLSDNVSLQDDLFIGSQLSYFHVLLPQHEFTKAENHLGHLASINAGKLEVDHYLRSFSIDELKEVIRYADDWSVQDVQHARALLSDQGIAPSKQDMAFTREARLESMRDPVGRQWMMIAFGYFFSAIGGVFGIILGLILNTQKRTLPNGEKVYYYDHRDRRHGFYIFVLGVFILLGLMIMRIVR